MNVKMKETYQGVGQSAVLLHEEIAVSILEKGEAYRVDNTLGNWLIDNGKAEEYTSEPVHYGGQAEPEYPRNDETKYEEQTGIPVANTEASKPRRSKRTS